MSIKSSSPRTSVPENGEKLTRCHSHAGGNPVKYLVLQVLNLVGSRGEPHVWHDLLASRVSTNTIKL